MSEHVIKQFRLTDGVDTYNPEVVGQELQFLFLTNIEPRLGRLFASRGYSSFQDLTSYIDSSDYIIGFSYYELSTRDFASFYLFSKTKVFWFDFSTGLFNTTPVYSSFPNTNDPYVFLPWYDALYVTKPRAAYVKLQRKTATEIAGAPWGRYGIVANSHAYLGGVGDGITNNMAQVRWSDLDDPESWAFNADSSEADFFDLEPDSRQITGVSYQRGRPIDYAENSIWIGSYIGFPGGFRHDPLFPGLGNIFHNAVIRNKEIDFFIGQDNFYALNGLQPVPIGDNIFERFINDVVVAPSGGAANVSVQGYLDSRKSQIFWVYPSIANGLWSVVFNYKENKWSERDPQAVNGWYDSPRIALRGYDSIDDTSTVIDDDSEIIDDPLAGYPVVLPQLVGIGRKVAKANDTYIKYSGTGFACVLETFDFYFDEINSVKEVNKAVFSCATGGTPAPQVQIGSRSNQGDAVTWGAVVDVTNSNGNMSFYFRKDGVGKFLRFRFLWTNSASNYITDLRLLSLVKIEESEEEHGTPEK